MVHALFRDPLLQRLVTRFRDVGVRKLIAQFFARKRANVLQILFDFGGSAHAKLGRRVWRLLRNTHGVGEAVGRVSAAFGDEIARCRRSKSRNFYRRRWVESQKVILSEGSFLKKVH